ncbi:MULTISPECIES: hypothetical protein [unclassified Microbulbifer]|uniref:hypothetical protein n=1 Tax=unclassified Microbulbifer TaxID=2619833 RepID=UPI0027E53316|nr:MULTISPECIES: hypothetical protein [unclassified Microbulbifer]
MVIVKIVQPLLQLAKAVDLVVPAQAGTRMPGCPDARMPGCPDASELDTGMRRYDEYERLI